MNLTDIHGPDDFAIPVPSLPHGVALCDGIPRASWIPKCVTLRNKSRNDLAKGVCHSVDADDVIDSDGKLLGDDRVAIQIVESLCEEEVPLPWMWSMHSWHIKQVFLNGVSLYDHDQTFIYKTTMNAIGRRLRVGVRSYESSRERKEADLPPKKDSLLTADAILQVSTKVCCGNNCLQPFPRGYIQLLRSELHFHGGMYVCKKNLLEVHRQTHKDATGKEWITLRGREVCPTAWWTIHGISKATFYRYKGMARNGHEAKGHKNLGLKKPCTQTLQATATLRTLIENDADKMPQKSRTLQTGEKVPAMVLPSSFRWSDQLPAINETNVAFDLPPISSSELSNIRRASFPEFAAKAGGDNFSRCGLCDRYKQLRSACTPLSHAAEKWTNLLGTHRSRQKAHRLFYCANRHSSQMYPEKMLCVIHDKMDHSKISSPHYSHKTKVTDSFMKMPFAVTGMIAHGHGDVRYAHYGVDIFPTDSNHTIGSIAKLLRDLEGSPKNSSRQLFSIEDAHSTLTKALLQGSEGCLDSLLPPPVEPIPAKSLPLVLTLQLDNASGDNKNRWVFAFCSLLVFKGIFREIYMNFLIVGHTHEDIDALFGRWSTMLKSNSYPTIPRLMKSFMDCEKHPVILHLIEEVPDFKRFVRGYLGTGGDFLEGHSSCQQFKFFMDSNGWPLMEYKYLCTDPEWLPEHGNGIRLWSETTDGRLKVPNGSPPPLVPQEMKGLDEVKKGLDGFVSYWAEMANEDQSGEFRRKNDPIKNYWKGVRAALDAPLVERNTLQYGFWPASRINNEVEDQMEVDGTLREEYAEDPPFVGRRRDRPRPSFRIGRDVYAGYFVVVRPADDDPKPFWLARAITNPSPDPGHVHQIKIQYWTPTSSRHINMETYDGWDTKGGNLWREDGVIKSDWSNTDCIMTAWKPRGKQRTDNELTKVAIPKTQIDIIKSSVVAFLSTSNNGSSLVDAED